ncbi:MAG: CsgG/HfaB family protein [Thermodesulfovibrionales bacterium]|nr:CsgG/HfaB family protein [Thermodesulfovibrionales bacterium]
MKGYKDALNKAADLYYSLGNYFLSKQLCRNAWSDFNEVTKIKPDFKNVNEKIKEAETCSVTKIAFIKFDNPTGKNIAGASMGDLIFDEIKSSLQKRASQFIRVMDREELETILSEQKLGMSGITDEYATFKRLKGVHYLIFGKLSQVYFNKPVQKQESRQTTGKEPYSCTQYDKKGRPYELICYRNVNVHFKQISANIGVSLTGSMKVLGVSSGEQVIYHNINVKKEDSVTYAADFSRDISQVKVGSEITTLADARRDLTGEDSLTREVVNDIANDMIRQILDKIDRPTSVSDPVELKVESETPKIAEKEILQPVDDKLLKKKSSGKKR